MRRRIERELLEPDRAPDAQRDIEPDPVPEAAVA
jgi:hypothetical protein